MTRILLLRHAESTWNQQQRWQGWADPPLTPAGRRAATLWAAHPPARFDLVVSSDLTRARDTAEIIAAALRYGPVELCGGLREQDQGAWTGLTRAQIKRQWPDRLRERPRRPVDGETAPQVQRRVGAALAALVSRPARSVLVVTHTGVIREVERRLGCDPRPIPHLEGRWIEPCGSADDGVAWIPGEPTSGRSQGAAQAATGQ